MCETDSKKCPYWNGQVKKEGETIQYFCLKYFKFKEYCGFSKSFYVNKKKGKENSPTQMNESLRVSIVNELKECGCQELGTYARVYPDNPDATTSGVFEIHFEQNEDEELDYYKATFQILANEDGFLLDKGDFGFYETFTDKQEASDYINGFLNKFGDAEALFNYIKKSFNFCYNREQQKQAEIMELLREATCDSVITCPRCCSSLEADAPECPYCHWENALHANGYI